MDEMKIKSGLVFDKHNGTLVGFTDLGSVNRDIETIMGGKEDVRGKPADHVFVFLARSVFKPSLSLPVAHYFSLNLRGTYEGGAIATSIMEVVVTAITIFYQVTRFSP